MVKVKYASLVNIIARKEIIPEFIQYNCTAANLTTAICSLLEDEYKRVTQASGAKLILRSMGFEGKAEPSSIAASIVIKLLQ